MTQYHLHLKGYVGGCDFNADDVTATLRSNPDTEEDLLEHRSDGTDAFDTLYIGCEKFFKCEAAKPSARNKTPSFFLVEG